MKLAEWKIGFDGIGNVGKTKRRKVNLCMAWEQRNGRGVWCWKKSFSSSTFLESRINRWAFRKHRSLPFRQLHWSTLAKGARSIYRLNLPISIAKCMWNFFIYWIYVYSSSGDTINCGVECWGKRLARVFPIRTRIDWFHMTEPFLRRLRPRHASTNTLSLQKLYYWFPVLDFLVPFWVCDNAGLLPIARTFILYITWKVYV